MNIRKAELVDLNACLLLDASYVTDHVWQMEGKETEDAVSFGFRTVRLPRSMRVDYPRHTDSLIENWRRGECFLVAVDDGELIGFLDLTVHTWNMTGWINNLVVESTCRRHRIGTALLRSSVKWCQEHGLWKIVGEAQTKNYPAIRFYQKNSFDFCGFNDRYYVNQDIALFFVQPLR